jgi:DNA-binding transcriptional ArsR family regulator
MHLRGRPLVLIPLVFTRSVLMGVSEGQRSVAIGYQARGTAELWAPSEVEVDDRLDLLLGHGRATVLRALERPATTTELARRLSYAPSTVSGHLDVLARAGLVDRHRVRRSVFYGLNQTGASLVALLADIPEVLSA